MAEPARTPQTPPDRNADPDAVTSAAEEAAQVRQATDSGRTHDKVAAPDPATAPLGTDDEAAGTQAGNPAAVPLDPVPAAPEPSPGIHSGSSPRLPVGPAVALAIIAVCILIGLFFALVAHWR